MNITQDLKNTLIKNQGIEKVYFDKFGDHYFVAHPLNGKLYHRIKDQTATVIKAVDGRPGQTKKERIIEANPDHELVKVLDAVDVLNAPVADDPVFADHNSREVFEAQAKENARLRKELEDAKSAIPSTSNNDEMEQLKAQLAAALKDKEELEDLINKEDTAK